MRALLPLCVLPLVLGSGACVVVYQPLTGLQKPVVLDTGLANFEGLRLQINCVPNDFQDRTGAKLLCKKLETVFTNQGATVSTHALRGAPTETDDEEDDAEAKKPADLTMTLEAREIHRERNPILWVISFVTFTLLPAVTEYTFAQDISIRDASGFLLASETFQARIVRYFGAGAWVGNWILDKAVREESERLSGDAASRDFSHDFYGRLSQIVFNARMRRNVLLEAERAAAEPPR